LSSPPVRIAPLLAVALLSLLTRPTAAAEERSLYQRAWTWTEDSGDRVALSKWQGQDVFLTMAYSSCRATCAMTLHTLELIQKEQESRGRSVQIVIVSYDPHNDTPEVWAAYRRQRHLDRANWHFLTGDALSTEQVARALGLGDFWAADRHIVHDFRIVRVDRDGRIGGSLHWGDSSLEALQ
jgi:cytochrome oxidase Cu insertion factor (SCO1/SenC/PrrC family)